MRTASLKRHLQRLVKHGGWIALSVSVLVLSRWAIPEAQLRAATEVGGSFLQTFGGMYGIILAFAIYVTWGQHNDAQVAVEHEAVSLVELYGLIGNFPSWREGPEVRKQLHRYALAVPDTHRLHPTREKIDEHAVLTSSIAAFLRHAPAAGTEERLFSAALDLFHELNEAREHRITVANLRLPEGLRWFVYLGGAFTVIALDLMWVDAVAIQAVYVAGMTWVVVAGASIALDLDDPYSGDFIIEWSRFRDAAKLMEKHDSLPPT